MGKIVVIGSINADLITTTECFPQVGETIIGKDFTMLPGGKGANQAVCAAKLGADVSFIGCVGNDRNGEFLLKNFKRNNINVDGVEVINDIPTGVAQITVANNDNSIIVVTGANSQVTEEIVNKNIEIINEADVVIMQLEIPLKTVEYVIKICYEKGTKVILNPAPSCDLDKSIMNKITYLTPNEIELENVFGESRDVVLKKYPNKVIMTCGDKGVFYHNGSEVVNIKGFKVKVVDTTGAGDSFNGALAYAITNNYKLQDALEFANKVASKTVEGIGAQTAMPTIEKIKGQ